MRGVTKLSAKQGIFLYQIFFRETRKSSPEFFFQLVKQDICTPGFYIQLSIYINIKSLLDTEKEAWPGVHVIG